MKWVVFVSKERNELMSRKLLTLAVLVFSLFLLSSCSEKITSGEVVDKKYTPEHTEQKIIPVTIYTGKTSSVIMVPYMYHYNDCWEITIRDWDEKEAEFVTATYRVTEDAYNNTYIGGEFEYIEEMNPNTPEYTRERQ